MRSSLLLALCCAALLCVVAGVQSQEISAPAPRADMAERAEEMGLVELESLSAADAAEEAADAAEAAADERTAALDAAMIAEDEATAAAAPAAFSMDDSAEKDRILVEAASQDGISSPFTDKLKAKTQKLKAEGKKAAAKLKAAAKAASTKAAAKIKAGAAAVKSRMQATMDQIKAALLGTPKPPAAVPVAAAAAVKPAAQSVAAPVAAVKQTKIPTFVASRAATARDMRLKRQADLAKAKLAREAADAAEYAAAVKLSWQSKKFERPLYSSPIQPHPSSHQASVNGDRNFNTLFPANTPLSDGKAPSQDSDFQHAGQGDLYVGHTGMIQHSEAVSQRPRGAQAPEPCSEQCEGKGLWRTAACQDCIVRGMTNGWIVKSIQEQQKGYNYVHFARNQCVKYANEQHLRSDSVKGAPFAACFFQKMHETCNL